MQTPKQQSIMKNGGIMYHWFWLMFSDPVELWRPRPTENCSTANWLYLLVVFIERPCRILVTKVSAGALSSGPSLANNMYSPINSIRFMRFGLIVKGNLVLCDCFGTRFYQLKREQAAKDTLLPSVSIKTGILYDSTGSINGSNGNSIYNAGICPAVIVLHPAKRVLSFPSGLYMLCDFNRNSWYDALIMPLSKPIFDDASITCL